MFKDVIISEILLSFLITIITTHDLFSIKAILSYHAVFFRSSEVACALLYYHFFIKYEKKKNK